jgi:hypothetical protein
MQAKVFDAKDPNKKKRRGDVSMDFDLTIATPAPTATMIKTIVKTFTADVELADATAFKDSDYIANLAKTSGISADQVEVVSKSFEVEVGFTFTGAAVTESAAKKAIAAAWKVTEDKVTVKLPGGGRRLRDGEELKRRLADTEVTATLKTSDAAVANKVKAEAVTAKAEVTKELQKANIVVTTAAKTPKLKVKVVTKLKSKPGATVAVATPDNTKIAAAATAAGGTGATIDPASVSEAVTQKPRPIQLGPSASAAVGTAFVCGTLPGLLAMAMTLAIIVE